MQDVYLSLWLGLSEERHCIVLFSCFAMAKLVLTDTRMAVVGVD